MTEKRFSSRIIHKHAVESDWLKLTDFIPMLGEMIIYDKDETYSYERFKIGDGATVVGSLPFADAHVLSEIDTLETNTNQQITTVSQALLNVASLVGDTAVSEQIGAAVENVLYKTPQELTIEEVNQVRQNIHSVGQYATGLTYYPFDPQETTDDLVFNKTLLDPVVAAEGAEIYNDYENNVATGYYSIASGFGTQALGHFSHSSGWLTKAGGYCSIASGRRTEAVGPYAHSEGIDTSAPKNASHSEGEGTKAAGARAHAEGYYTEAKHNQAHSEGMLTVASGVNSHAEGWGTTASGQNAFSGGRGTTASGANSTAKGEYTIAAGKNQTALGKYNVSDTTSLMIIGNGTSDTARSNAYILDSSGNGWFAGGITVGENKVSVITEEDYIIFDGGTSEDVI